MPRQSRAEGNIWYNIGTCAPLLILLAVFTIISTPILGESLAGVIMFPILIVFALVYLWIPSWLFKKAWYLDINQEGVLYKAIIVSHFYSWAEVSDVTSEKSAEFSGRYDDNLLFRMKGETIRFFLPDFGLTTKRETTAFIDMVTKHWNEYQERKEMGYSE